MGRKILAVVTAMITGFAVIWVGWMISTLAAFSTPSQMEHVGQSDVNRYAASAPPMTYVIALICYALAGFAAGFVVTKMARRWTTGGYSLSIVCGVLLMTAGLVAEHLCTIRKDDDDEHPGDAETGYDVHSH